MSQILTSSRILIGSNMFDNLWVEKYRPGTLDDIVLTDQNRSTMQKFDNVKEIPNIILTGKPGIGKTSLAKILVNDTLKCQYIYINASDENGIETVRTKITNFSRAQSLDGNIKVIILDEVDGLTLDAQRALRNTMEEYSQYVRFVLTANFSHRVIPALQSRCQSFDLTPTMDQYISRCQYVLDQENVKCDDVQSVVSRYYPDLRKGVNELQKLSESGTIITISDKLSDNFASNIFKVLSSNPGNVHQLRKHIIESESTFSGDYPELLVRLFNVVDDSKLKPQQKSECLLIVSEHMYRSAFVLDQEINFYSCLVALSKAL